MDDGEYARERIVTVEKMMAGFLVLAWILIGLCLGGIPLAVRATLVFMWPLALVWMPNLMAKISGVASRKSLSPEDQISGVIGFISTERHGRLLQRLSTFLAAPR